MKIPKQFELFGHTIKVEWRDDLLDTEGVVGMCFFRENRIVLQRLDTPAYRGRVKECSEVTFFHEVLHFILDHMKRDELKRDEEFVNIFALCLHQALKTAKY